MPRPVRGEVRRSLLDQLGTPSARLLLFSAPSGYGKTTLAAQYARLQARTVVWSSCTAATADPEALGDLLASALRRSGIGTPNWDALTLGQLGVDALAGALTQDLNAAPQDLLLVLDHADHLAAESARLFTTLVEGLGDWHQVWVNTHDASPLNFARLLAAGTAEAYGPEKLRFSAAETAALVEQLALTGERARRVLDQQQHAGGWPAVIALAAAPGSRGQEVTEIVASILDRMPARLRTLVLQASVIENWTDDLPEAIQLPACPGWLDEAQRRGLPLRQIDSGRFRPDDLIRTALDDLLRRDPVLYQALHARASALALTWQDPYLAAYHALAAKQMDVTQNIVQAELLPRWQRYSDWTLAAEMLGRLPASQLRPELLAFLGLALGETGQGDAARSIYETQLAQGTQTAITYFGLALAAFRKGQAQECLTLCDLGLAGASTPYERTQLLRSRATAALVLQHVEEARTTAEQAVQEAQCTNDPSLLISAQTVLFWVYDADNQAEEARRTGRQAFELAVTLGFVGKALALAPQLFSAHVDIGALGEAGRYAAYLRDHAERYPLFIQQQALIQGELFLLQNEPVAALTCFRTALDLAAQRNESAAVSARYAWFAAATLGQGDVMDAVLDELAEALRQGQPSASDVGLALVGRALLRKETAQAAELLQAIGAVLNRDYRMSWQTIGHDLLSAEVGRRLGTLKTDDIVRLVRDRHPAGLVLILRLYEPFTTLLAQEALQRGWAPEIFGQVLAARLPQAVPTYQFRTLGGLGLSLRGEALKVPAKALELLAYLSLNGPTSVAVLADALAPESLSARNRVQRARADLTRDVGGDVIETVTGAGTLYRLGAHVALECDALQVLRAQSAQEVLAAYQGEFLPGSQEPWVQEVRERLARHVAGFLIAQAEKLRMTDLRQAQAWYGRALQVEPGRGATWDAYREVGRHLADSAAVMLADRALEALEDGVLPLPPLVHA